MYGQPVAPWRSKSCVLLFRYPFNNTGGHHEVITVEQKSVSQFPQTRGGATFGPIPDKPCLVNSTQENALTISNGQLKSLIERIERLETEKQALTADIKEVYGEAKANGFDIKIMRKVVSLRKKDSAERQEEEAMLDLYLGALGMQQTLPFSETE